VTASHLLVHHSSDKRRFYEEASQLLWSDELECWTSSEKETILQILKDKDFHAVDYLGESKKLAGRLKVDFLAMQELLECVPLGLEGARHAAVRRTMAVAIREKSTQALDAFAECMRERIAAVVAPGSNFNITAEVFSPCVARLMFALSDVWLEPGNGTVSPAQVFDRTLSVNRRKILNRRIAEILDGAKNSGASDEAALRAAIVIVGSDSLLGSLTESFLHEVKRNSGKRLSDFDWSDKLPVTAVPYVERIATKQCQVAGRQIAPGKKIRLYLDSFEFSGPETSDFYFGAGRHVCLGRSISARAWQIATSLLGQVDCRVQVKRVDYRRSDYVFKLAESVEVAVHND
jgi:hypothetical protein